MIKSLSDYEVAQCINSDGVIALYRARSLVTDEKCLLKIPVQDSTPEPAASLLKNEYAICSKFDSDHIIRINHLIRLNNSCFMECRYSDVIPLAIHQGTGIFSLQPFLSLAINIVELLLTTHNAGIIHKNLSPYSILKDLTGEYHYLTGFYVASMYNNHESIKLSRLSYAPSCPYIAPEQTGNIDCAVDERTDLYSLGVIFYELLCGELPFTDSDPAALMYSHVACEPVPVSSKNSDVPPLLSNMVQKLLAKNPSDRYQNACGLLADLKELQYLFLQGCQLRDAFTLGSNDRITSLLPTKKLYGRNEHLEQLADALTDADNGQVSCVFISGQAGVGKTRLIEEFRESLDNSNVLFAHGKCEQSSTNIPYHALTSSIIELIREITGQDNSTVSRWRARLLDNMQHNRELITEFIPEIQMIIGSCKQTKRSDAAEPGTQFKNAFTQFLRAFLQDDTLLVLCIDDLQWADSALITILLPAFFEDTNCKFLFIGAGRTTFNADNPIYSHISKTGVKISTIELQCLTLDDTRQIVADSLGLQKSLLHDVDTMLFEKTNGNPLFLKEFMTMLIARGHLIHQVSSDCSRTDDPSLKTGNWKWHINKIEQLGCSENVVDIIIDKAKKLPRDTQHFLTIASCIGLRFNCEIISSIDKKKVTDVIYSLSRAIEIGILIYDTSVDNQAESHELRFSHDRIREALYNRLDSGIRTNLHLSIGRTLLKLTASGKTENSFFDIVNHFNPFDKAIDDPAERHEIAVLNRDAGIRAKNSYAYEIAISHLTSAIAFLPQSVWETDLQFRFETELLIAECEYLLNRFDDAQQRLAALSSHAIDQKQLASVDLITMSILDHNQETEAALTIGLKRLSEMGIKLPHRPSLPYLLTELFKAALVIRSVIHSKTDTSPTPSPTEEVALSSRILNKLCLQAFILQKFSLVIAITTYLIQSSKTCGLSGASSVAFCWWGIFISMITRNPARGLGYGNLALTVSRRFDDIFSRGITYFLYGSFFSHLEGHLDNSLEIVHEGRRFSNEAGDSICASHSTEGYLLFSVLSGKNLEEVRRIAEESTRFLKLIGVPRKGQKVISFIQTWADNLENNLDCNVDEYISSVKNESPLLKGIILFFVMFQCYLTGEFSTALHIAENLKGNPLLDPTTYFYFFYHFLHALTIAAASTDRSITASRRKLSEKIRILKKGTERSPVNTKHLYLLIVAEHHRMCNRLWDASRCYRQSIDIAYTRGFVHYAAMAAERTASFFKPHDITDSRAFSIKSMSLYYEWGASAKVKLLKREAPEIPFNPYNRTSALPGFADLDIQAILRSFEAISNELHLDRLLEKLIRIVMENVGAQRGVLLLENQGTFNVYVEGTLVVSKHNASAHIESHMVNIPSEQFSIPQSIISYVSRSRESVRLQNAADHGRFVNDPFVKSGKIKSVLCVPLVNSDRIRGIFYLENNSAESAFPQSRLQLLKLLCGQAVISIENALFHEVEIKHLRAKVNPHFLFNALSSIAELCQTDPDASEDAIIRLSTLYRYILAAETKLVTLEEELEIVNKYLSIEKLRFGSRLSYDITISGNPSFVNMPSMLLQPLVENSIKHGISQHPSGGSITITAVITEDRCTVTVENTGSGSSKSTGGTGYGLQSIQKRLALHYNDDASFGIDDTNGYKVYFSIPLNPQN